MTLTVRPIADGEEAAVIALWQACGLTRPWNDPAADLAFARGIVSELEREQPRLYTTNSRKAARKGRVFLDYLRNARGATAIAPYSTRAREGAPVATPLAWSELEQPFDPAGFTVYTVPERLAGLDEDPWADALELSQSIPASSRRRARR